MKQTETTLQEALNSALKALQEARLRKAKADGEFDLASAEVAALAMRLSNMEIGADAAAAKDYTTTNSKQGTTGIQTLSGFAVGDAVVRAKRDTATGKVVNLYPRTNRVRVLFDDKELPGNYVPKNLRKL